MLRRTFRERKPSASKLKEEQKRISDAINADKKNLEDLEEKLEALAFSIRISEKRKAEIKKQIMLSENHLTERRMKLVELDKEIMNAKKELKEKQKETEDYKKGIRVEIERLKSNTEKEINIGKTRVEKLIRETKELEIKKETLEREASFLFDQVKAKRLQSEDSSKVISSNEASIERQDGILLEKAKELEELEKKIEEKNSALKIFKEKIEKITKWHKEKTIEFTILEEKVQVLEVKRIEVENEIKANENRILDITRRETRLNEMKDKLKELYSKAGIKIDLD